MMLKQPPKIFSVAVLHLRSQIEPVIEIPFLFVGYLQYVLAG
jgi:hypothetical protein